MASEQGFNGLQFQSAVARRKGKGPVLHIEHWVFDSDDDEVGRQVDADVMVDPRLDVIRFGELFGSFATELRELNTADDTTDADKMKRLQHIINGGIDKLRGCIVPTQRAAFDTVSGALDAQMISHIIQGVAKELSPMDPTQPTSSSTGSDGTSVPSTDGVVQDVSTSQAPLSAVP